MSTRPEPHAPSKATTPPGAIVDDVILRERAHAPVESAIRSHFATLGGGADEASIRNATSIVLRGLTPSALSRIASAGVSGSELIQTLIPKPAQSNVLPAFNWSSITPAEIERLRSLGLLSEYHRKMALGRRGGGERSESERSSSASFDGLSHNEAAYFADMRNHALKHGLGWAANNRDILRLGPAAIETLGKARLQRETWQRLRTDGGMVPAQIVNMADYANRTGVDANKLGNAITDVNKGLSEVEKKAHNEALDKYWEKHKKANSDAEREAAKQELDKFHKGMTNGRPGLKPKIDELNKALEPKKQRDARADAAKAGETIDNSAANTEKSRESIKAEAEIQAGNDKLAALLRKPASALAGSTPAAGPTAAAPTIAPKP